MSTEMIGSKFIKIVTEYMVATLAWLFIGMLGMFTITGITFAMKLFMEVIGWR
jgi:hypothetical protein